jgi:hypothetical protein
MRPKKGVQGVRGVQGVQGDRYQFIGEAGFALGLGHAGRFAASPTSCANKASIELLQLLGLLELLPLLLLKNPEAPHESAHVVVS